MPYIDREHRTAPITTPGVLNYKVTTLLLDYLILRGETYQTYNDIIGVLECAKLEMYRRRTSDYEDKKMAENGDVY